MQRIDKEFFQRDSLSVARDLIGKIIVHEYNHRKRVGIKYTEEHAELKWRFILNES